jgi:ubiquinone/menaquinone biosynthesis C-methylase UbiE
MSSDSEAQRIRDEYQRRGRTIQQRFYDWDRPSSLMEYQSLVRVAIRELARSDHFPLAGRRVLDVGCGSGRWLLEFLQWGANPKDLAGIDLIPERVDAAKVRVPQAEIQMADATSLPWPDGSFDVVSQFTVFTSILDDQIKQKCAAEMLRVLKLGGVILWYDFRVNNPRNAAVRGIERNEIDSLFAGSEITLRRTTLAPPVARLVAPHSWLLAYLLERVPPLRTHYVGIIRKV